MFAVATHLLVLSLCHSSVLSMYISLQIELDFRLLFGEVTGNTFLERWPNTLKTKVIMDCLHTTEPFYLILDAELAAEAENGVNGIFTFAA